MKTEKIDQSEKISSGFYVAPGVWGGKELFVNFYIVQAEHDSSWVLIDAGLRWSASGIKALAAELFGEESKPSAILLTHGHFDHVGALTDLVREWNVPVYAHELELPYLTGQSAYPPADATVGGGIMSAMSFMYPNGPIDISENIKRLPYNGTIPGLPEWKFIETPGHSPGHVSFFREHDRVLIAGDAFVTTKAESAFYALTAKEHLSGPPKYFTCNWASAKMSLYKILQLKPEIVATGHGKPMAGESMRKDLEILVVHFEELAEPQHGMYVNEPAVTNRYGVASWPHQDRVIPLAIKFGLVSLSVSAAVVLYSTFFRNDK